MKKLFIAAVFFSLSSTSAWAAVRESSSVAPGASRNGLAVALQPLASPVHSGLSIPMVLEIRNTNRAFVFYTRMGRSHYFFSIVDAQSGQPVPLRNPQKIFFEYLGGSSRGQGLPAGSSEYANFDLSEYVDLKPGKYLVTVVVRVLYRASLSDKEADINLPFSKPIEVDVVP